MRLIRSFGKSISSKTVAESELDRATAPKNQELHRVPATNLRTMSNPVPQ